MRMHRHYKIVGLLFVLATLQGCGVETEVKERKAVTVSIFDVKPPLSSQFRNFKGTVAPADLTPLSFRVEGKLEAILVRKGQRIKKGELLAKLDTKKLRQQLADTQAQYELTVKQWSRGKNLLKRKMVSPSEFDELTASKRMAFVNFQIAKNNLEYTRLVAPFDGYISEVPKQSFENASPGEEILSVYRGDVVRIRIAISDTVLSMINPDRETRNYHVKTRFFGDEREFVSTYYQHSSEPAQGSNAFEFWLEMPQVEPAILPGTSASLDVDLVAAGLRIVKGYQIPMTALDAGVKENEFYVWKLIDGTVHKQSVDIIQISSHGAIVANGVVNGDAVVNSNLRKMREDAVVAIANKEEIQ
ncbi:efflux RND transporter periplasmic adaptor subunit [Vibrio sp. DW001]|uniref:efflux RND transporter periplasmic adaptor subunit n=1 Tax=Vibrio sp. DW001 TaxID=2912315 RepID=UPI0023AEDA48|nr:efflux RND transporter periplasmic adaptor subunit [Vibrio sp. DW001]WED29354.1 efflux RND transporter periplasmic adaptor subunit [Vibrio sp. DW001]